MEVAVKAEDSQVSSAAAAAGAETAVASASAVKATSAATTVTAEAARRLERSTAALEPTFISSTLDISTSVLSVQTS